MDYVDWVFFGIFIVIAIICVGVVASYFVADNAAKSLCKDYVKSDDGYYCISSQKHFECGSTIFGFEAICYYPKIEVKENA